ncbi:MAG: ABC transporter ATP-binding protein [Pseudomonadota bacterium]|nr:ABC transporter ATP-binding protein [Pseudomonadota bacterium]
MTNPMPLLQVNALTVRFGGVTAVDAVSLQVDKGEFVGLLGPNGAGKTTLLAAVCGRVTLSSGSIIFGNRDLSGVSVPARARLGIGVSHQIVRPFRSMTVMDNVILAAGSAITATPWRALMHVSRRSFERRCLETLDRVGLVHLAGQTAAAQPLGVLKRLEVARALATAPSMLLLDEPLAGLNHVESAKLADTVSSLHRGGMTIVLIEHKLGEVMRICPRLVVLDNGRKIGDGKAAEVIADQRVVDAYLGSGTTHAGS